MSEVITFRVENASADLAVWDDGTATLSSVYSKVPQMGHGSALMRHISEYADTRDLVVELVARRFGNPRGMDTAQLVEFYKKFGFVITDRPVFGGGVFMTRPPASQELQLP